MSEKKLILSAILIILLFIFPTFLRCLGITKDRPKTYEVDIGNHDDGVFVHNARNKALFGKWVLENDDWNPIYQYPTYTYVWYIFFKLFGVGFLQGRLLSIIFSLLSLILFYRVVNKGYDKMTAVIAALFLGYNFILMMFNTSMMVETFMIFFIILTFYFWEVSLRKRGYLFFVGFFCFLSVITKASSAWLLGTCIFSLLPLLLGNIKKKDFTSLKKGVFYFFTGLIICAVLYLFIFFIPNFSYIKLNLIDNQIQRIMGLREWDKPPVPLPYKVLTMPFNTQFFVRTPIISILAFIYIIYFITNLPKDFKKSDNMDFFVLNWIFFMFVFFVLFHNPIRRIVAMIPALAVFSARTIVNIKLILANKKEKGKFKLFVENILVLILLYVVVGNIIMYGFKGIMSKFHPIILKFISILNLKLPPFRSNALDSIISAVFALVLAVLILLFVKTTKLNLRIKKRIKRLNYRKIAILIVILFLLIDIGQYLSWSFTYKDSLYMASKDLGRILPENTKVYGMFAPGLAVENKIIPIYPEAPLINYKNRFEREDIRYVLIVLKDHFGSNEKEVAEWKEYYPDLKLIKIFYTNDAEGTEIGLFDKFPQRALPPNPNMFLTYSEISSLKR